MDIILRREDGTETVLRKNVSEDEEILFSSDYVARKLVTRDDIRGMLNNRNFAGTDEEINEIIKLGLGALNAMNDDDWDVIDENIRIAESNGTIKQRKDTPEGVLRAFGLHVATCADCLYFHGDADYCSVYDGVTNPYELSSECDHFCEAGDRGIFLEYDGEGPDLLLIDENVDKKRPAYWELEILANTLSDIGYDFYTDVLNRPDYNCYLWSLERNE